MSEHDASFVDVRSEALARGARYSLSYILVSI